MSNGYINILIFDDVDEADVPAIADEVGLLTFSEAHPTRSGTLLVFEFDSRRSVEGEVAHLSTRFPNGFVRLIEECLLIARVIHHVYLGGEEWSMVSPSDWSRFLPDEEAELRAEKRLQRLRLVEAGAQVSVRYLEFIREWYASPDEMVVPSYLIPLASAPSEESKT